MPLPSSQEFTPDLTSGYLTDLLNTTTDQERQAVGQARREGASAGLVGQAATGTRIASAVWDANQGYLKDLTNFGLGVAQNNYNERMTDQSQAWQSNEAEKNRQFQQQMAQLGYDFMAGNERAQEGFEKNQFWQTLIPGIAGSALSAGVGGYFGRK